MLPIIPTKLSEESIDRFIQICREDLNMEITREKAEEEGLRLLRLVIAVLENLPPEDIDMSED